MNIEVESLNDLLKDFFISRDFRDINNLVNHIKFGKAK